MKSKTNQGIDEIILNTIFNNNPTILRKAYHFDRLFLCLFLAQKH